jgi:hypothetical protein
MVGGIALLDQTKIAIEARRFSLHEGKLLVGDAFGLRAALAWYQLGLWSRREQCSRVADGELVHGNHQLGCFYLPVRLHFPERVAAVDGDLLVF